MSDTTKRLDLQFGSFACSVQGFDDPVQPVRQVLQALQNMLEESPEIGDSVLSFDVEAIERLIGEVARRADLQEKNVEIVPGLIIVQRRDAAEGTEAFDRDLDGADNGDGEAWSRPFVGSDNDTGGADAFGTEPGEAEADHEPEAVGNAEAGFVNIFTPAAHGDGDTGDAGADSGSGMSMTAAGDTSERAGDDAAREDEPARDIFGDPEDVADGDAGGSVFADPMAENTSWEPTDEGEPVNFFAAADRTDEGVEGTGNEIGEIGDEPGASQNLFASAEPEDSGEELVLEPGNGESERGEALFGSSDDQPEVAEADDGYTPGGLAQTAGAETVAELMVSAAAWMVLIQGKTTFTRHDVIDVFEGMPGEHSKTLEARIKGFGKAVRNDQLIMVEDGIFGLSRKELERFQRLL